MNRTLIPVALAALTLAACGSTDTEPSQDAPAKRGGTLTVPWSGDVDSIDPGITYYSGGYMVANVTQRTPMAFQPGVADARPDLATTEPAVSEDGRTVTVKLREGVRFSPPVKREVTAADVKYAIERGFFSSVASGFTASYYSDLEGAKVGVKPGTKISGIETPDDYTLVLKFKRPVAGVMASGALAYPMTAPVPEEYAKEFDAETPSTYGEHQLATGPYMISNDAEGNATGYEPGKRIHLVRNPNWDKSKDFKPAYLDEIENVQGNDDPGVASRRILTGESMINGDFAPLPENLKDALDNRPEQIKTIPGGGGRWVAMNTKIKPFDDINVRKAVLAGFDRNALLLTRGGKAVGDVATHILPPGMAGFEEAGGMKGQGLDFISEDGSPLPEVSAEYFKKAGYSSGKYEGTEPLLMVGSNAGVAKNTAEVAKEQFEKMGFKVQLRLVQHQTMYTRYCNTPSAKVAICPNVGWIRDFSDGQTMLSPTFAGKNILEQGNSNWPQLDVPEINEAIDRAELLPKEERPAAWAEIDRMVMEQAPLVPWIWDKTPLIQSANVNGVATESNGYWSLEWTSLK